MTADLLAGRAAGRAGGASAEDAAAHPILLYDGVCGLCNRLVQFILRRDPGVIRFASLQSVLAGRVLARHGADAHDLDTVYVVVDYEQPDERLLPRSDAIIFILKLLGAAPASAPSTTLPGSMFWRIVASLLRLVPRPFRDWVYGAVARNRYRVFGRSETCILPAPSNRDRFLDL